MKKQVIKKQFNLSSLPDDMTEGKTMHPVNQPTIEQRKEDKLIIEEGGADARENENNMNKTRNKESHEKSKPKVNEEDVTDKKVTYINQECISTHPETSAHEDFIERHPGAQPQKTQNHCRLI